MRFYIDVVKGEEGKSIGPRRLHKERLVRRMVQVKGKNGGTYSRMQWVDPRGDTPSQKHSSTESDTKDAHPHDSDLKDQVHKLVSKMSKEEKYQWLDKHGIQWKRNDHPNTDHIEAVKALKKFLNENPHHLDLEHLSKRGGNELDIESESDKLMNPVDKLINRKSKQEKWDLISKYGVQWKENSNDKINQMRAFSALKQYLKENLELAGLSKEDFDKANAMGDEVERVGQIGELVKKMSPKLKLGLAKQYKIEPEPTGDSNIDNINRTKAITKFLSEDAKELEFIKSKLEKHELKNMKISVKEMMAIIRRLGKLTPREIKASKEDKEWTFNDASMASINEDDNGNPVLSIIDGEHGKWEVKDILLKDVKIFLDGLDETKAKAKEAPKYGKDDIVGLLKTMFDKPQVKKMAEGLWIFRSKDGSTGQVEITSEGVTFSRTDKDWERTWEHDEVEEVLERYHRPLHEKSVHDIKEALEDDPELYKGRVKKRIEDSVRDDIFKHEGTYGRYDSTTLYADATFGTELLKTVAKEHAFWDPNTEDLDIRSDEFSEFMYKSLVDPEKSKNAMDYVVTTFGEDNPWVLKESAKNWEPIERRKARKEMWSSHGRVSLMFPNDVRGQISKHFNIVTGHLPFDIITDTLIKHGLSIKAPTSDKEDSPIFSYDFNDHQITLPYTCTEDADFLETEDPYEFHPSVSIDGRSYKDSSLGSTLTHEFGHAIDHFFAGGGSNTMTHWQGSKEAMKYLGKHSNALFESYSKSLGEATGNSGSGSPCSKRGNYYVHEDNFLSPYEGRIYGPTNKETGLPVGLVATSYSSNNVIDTTFKGATKPPKGVIWGCEHWSESVSKYSSAAHHYFKYMQETKGQEDSKSFPQWCTEGSKKYHEVKVNFDSKNELESAHPDLHSAFRYKHLEQHHPIMADAIDHLLNRGDFPPKLGGNEVRTRYTTRIGPNKKGQGRRSNAPTIMPKTAKSLTFYVRS